MMVYVREGTLVARLIAYAEAYKDWEDSNGDDQDCPLIESYGLDNFTISGTVGGAITSGDFI